MALPVLGTDKQCVVKEVGGKREVRDEHQVGLVSTTDVWVDGSSM